MSAIRSSSAITAAAYDVAVAKKALESTKESGKQAVALIQAAAPPVGAPGHLLDIQA